MKKMKKFESINVIPFIDIMLVLLVMVLTTATFIKQGIIPVELPEAKNDEKMKEIKELTINITKDGQFYVGKEKTTLEALDKTISDTPKDTTVVLRSDKNTKFKNFVDVMDILKKYNHEQLYIVTKD